MAKPTLRSLGLAFKLGHKEKFTVWGENLQDVNGVSARTTVGVDWEVLEFEPDTKTGKWVKVKEARPTKKSARQEEPRDTFGDLIVTVSSPEGPSELTVENVAYEEP